MAPPIVAPSISSHAQPIARTACEARGSRLHPPRVLGFAVALVLILQVFYGVMSPADMGGQRLRDADSYMRVLRVVDLHEKRNWYNSHFDRTNAPYGETLHWGRPLDAVLYAW